MKISNILIDKIINSIHEHFLYLRKNKAKKRPTKYNLVGLFKILF